MKSGILMWITATVLLMLGLPVQSAAQHTRYKLVVIPTFGGPAAIGQVDGPGISQFINNSGVVVGGADTTVPDPYCLNPDCFTPHAFRWQDEVLTDLGALHDTSFSHATSANSRGWITGGSFMSDVDPLTGQPTEHAVLWKDGKIVDLGTLGSGLESAGLYVNNAGEVVGFSTFDTTPDPSSFKGAAIHAFIWRNGMMQDLGTLGGPGAFPSGGCDNQRVGLVAGTSSTSSGESHAFLWDNGTMKDIPTLGGTLAGAQCANNKGQVLGQSTLPGDSGCPDNCFGHAFSWEHGTITDLGTLGGNFTLATWLNSNGEAVGGTSTTDDESFHAVLWRSGRIADLGILDGDCFSVANSINSRGQIIGQSFSCPDGAVSRAVLWDGGSIVDLNATIPPDSALQLTEGLNINDRGEIVGRGLTPGCDNLDLCGRVFLLIPCDPAGKVCEGNLNSVSQPIVVPGTNRAIAAPDPQRTREFIERQSARIGPHYQVPAR